MAKKKTRTRGGAKKKVRRGARGLAKVSLVALQAELERRLGALHAKREELAAELEELDAEIAGVEGAVATAPAPKRGRPAKKRLGRPAKKRPVGRPRKKRPVGRPPKRRPVGRPRTKAAAGTRPRNADSLVGSLGKLLKGKTMSVTEMSDKVQKAGYKTSSPNFRTIVNQTLINNPKGFKRVARGQYTAK